MCLIRRKRNKGHTLQIGHVSHLSKCLFPHRGDVEIACDTSPDVHYPKGDLLDRSSSWSRSRSLSPRRRRRSRSRSRRARSPRRTGRDRTHSRSRSRSLSRPSGMRKRGRSIGRRPTRRRSSSRGGRPSQSHSADAHRRHVTHTWACLATASPLQARGHVRAAFAALLAPAPETCEPSVAPGQAVSPYACLHLSLFVFTPVCLFSYVCNYVLACMFASVCHVAATKSNCEKDSALYFRCTH